MRTMTALLIAGIAWAQPNPALLSRAEALKAYQHAGAPERRRPGSG